MWTRPRPAYATAIGRTFFRSRNRVGGVIADGCSSRRGGSPTTSDARAEPPIVLGSPAFAGRRVPPIVPPDNPESGVPRSHDVRTNARRFADQHANVASGST